LAWSPRETFDSGMRRTVGWYLANGSWLQSVENREYQQWISLNYATA